MIAEETGAMLFNITKIAIGFGIGYCIVGTLFKKKKKKNQNVIHT